MLMLRPFPRPGRATVPAVRNLGVVTSQVTIVMYHYVRDVARTRYPNVKGLSIDGFRRQVGHLQQHHTIVRMEDVIAAAEGAQLPPNAALLTFDDGYAEHYDVVFPILHDLGLQGSFFPPVAPVRDAELLDVNRVHFILASASSPTDLAGEVDRQVSELRSPYGLDSVEAYRAEWAHANRFDDADTIYVKRMLQTALPPEVRQRIAKALFARYVAVEESAFANELYMSEDQARLMVSCGMHFGSHGRSHRWLNRVERATQVTEIDGSLEFLRDVGMPVTDGWVMCYPYGGWNESLLEVIRERGGRIGLTTEVATADLAVHDPLRLPRYDTNDFPQ